jgi:hypothetical protein
VDCAGHEGRSFFFEIRRPELRTNGGSDLFYPKPVTTRKLPVLLLLTKKVFFMNNFLSLVDRMLVPLLFTLPGEETKSIPARFCSKTIRGWILPRCAVYLSWLPNLAVKSLTLVE